MKTLLLLFTSLLFIGCGTDGARMLPDEPEIISALITLKEKKKFVKDMALFYSGAPDEITRTKAEKIINGALNELIAASEKGVSEEKFWAILESAARHLSKMDSEENDRGLTYMEEIMDIYEIKSSGGRLNDWRYGFNPNK